MPLEELNVKISNLTPQGPLHSVEPSKQARAQVDKAAATPPQTNVHPGPASADGQDIDMARVNEIRQAISEGRLTVNLEKIADGLIESTRNLLNGKP